MFFYCVDASLYFVTCIAAYLARHKSAILVCSVTGNCRVFHSVTICSLLESLSMHAMVMMARFCYPSLCDFVVQ